MAVPRCKDGGKPGEDTALPGYRGGTPQPTLRLLVSKSAKEAMPLASATPEIGSKAQRLLGPRLPAAQ
jgi:hypothetical protein